jgi:hypothetical protein
MIDYYIKSLGTLWNLCFIIEALFNQHKHVFTSRTLYLACECNDDSSGKGGGTMYKGSQELLKSANLLFSTLEPCYIWIYAGTLFVEACEQQTNDETASPEHESSSREEVKPVGSGPPSLLEV